MPIQMSILLQPCNRISIDPLMMHFKIVDSQHTSVFHAIPTNDVPCIEITLLAIHDVSNAPRMKTTSY